MSITREQGEALMAYVAAFVEASEVAHMVSRHNEDAGSMKESEERRVAALNAFRALLP